MNMTVARLHKVLRTALPSVVGVAIGRKDDRSTWRVDFADRTSFRLGDPQTEQRHTQVAALLEAFDPNAAPPIPTIEEKLAKLGITSEELKALLAK